METWQLGLAAVVIVVLSLAIRRQDGPVDHALENTKTFGAEAELNANIERTRNVPPA